MSKKLHIIAFDVPHPPNYGGIIDVFYKLKSLHEAGAEINFHCYHYKGKNPPTEELGKYCNKLIFYERKKSFHNLLSKIPFIVVTRNDPNLLANVLSDPAPVLIEGLHCAYWMDDADFKDQKILIRAHNIEHDYYNGLANQEKNLLRRLYLRWEASKLRRFEPRLRFADVICSIAKQDMPHFEHYARTVYTPPFFDNTVLGDCAASQARDERFILFHGNLSVTENEQAALYIVSHIAPKTKERIKIAGKSPSNRLKAQAAKQPHVQLIDTPPQEQMNELIQKAHIHLLLTFQQTGVKLKLLHALQSGKHVIINSLMDDAGVFSDLCEVADNTEDTVEKINELIEMDFTEQMKEDRDRRFNAVFDNQKKAQQILDLI